MTLGSKEVYEKPGKGEQQMIMLYLGINSFSTTLAVYMMNLKTYCTSALHLIFTVWTFYCASNISQE